MPKLIPVELHGIKFPSVSAAAVHFGVEHRVVRDAMHRREPEGYIAHLIINQAFRYRAGSDARLALGIEMLQRIQARRAMRRKAA